MSPKRIDDGASSGRGPGDDTGAWPVISRNDVGIPIVETDLAYMGFYLRMEIKNFSSYLVREAVLRIDGKGPGIPGQITPDGVVTSREIKVGPLLPGVFFHEEIGIGARGGINGYSFDTVSVQAVGLTPPDQMKPAGEYPGLTSEIIEVTKVDEVPDLRRPEDDRAGVTPTAPAITIRIRVCNTGRETVDRVRLRLSYFDDGGAGSGGSWVPVEVADWILDMPRPDWNPYRLPDPPDAVIEPADPLMPGRSYEFTIVHYDRGPDEWAGGLDATKVEVIGQRLFR